jgi:hypothetical protein
MTDSKSMTLKPEIVREACIKAAEILSGMGYIGSHGSVHLLKLNLQSNTVTAILHNMVAWQISQLDSNWSFKPKGGRTPDLTNLKGEGAQIKATSDEQVKGNKVSPNEGYYIIVKYSRENYTIQINEILMGDLKRGDWQRPKGTQWAILKPEAEARLRRIYP